MTDAAIHRRSGTLDRALATVALTLLGLNAGLAMAHVLEAPNKGRLAPEVWFAVQRDLYNGWGTWIPLMELITAALVGVLAWRAVGAARWLLLAALLSLVVAEAVIWPIWVLPTNQAVDAYAGAQPMPGWEALRASWVSGHAARFAVLATGLLAALRAVLPRLAGPRVAQN